MRWIQEILWWKSFEWGKILWWQRKCSEMVVTGITSTVSCLTKIGHIQSGGCHESIVQESVRSPKREQWQSGGWNTLWNQQSWEPAKGWYNSSSYQCGPLNLETLYDNMYGTQKSKSNLKFVTRDKQNNMSTLWRGEEFTWIYCGCNEHLTGKTQIDHWCCFYDFVRNSLVVLLEILCVQMWILSSQFWEFLLETNQGPRERIEVTILKKIRRLRHCTSWIQCPFL